MINLFKKFNTKNILFFIIITVCLSQLSKFYSFYVEYSEWQYSDWLINYQAGFVRRGFIGEILFQIYSNLNIRLDILVLIFVFILIIFFTFLLFKSIENVYENHLNILIFLSPGFFLYPLMNSEIVGRKDILMISVVGFFCFFGNRFKKNYLLMILISCLVLTILSHSAFIFYSPYLIFLYFLILEQKKISFNLIDKSIIFLVIIFLFLLIYFNQGDLNQVVQICNSIKLYVTEKCSKVGQIAWLASDMDNYISEKIEIGFNFKKSLIIYFLSFLLVNFFLGLKLLNSKFTLIQNKYLLRYNPLLIFGLLFLFTIPVYILALDWGRYIYVSYSCSFFIAIFCYKSKILLSTYNLRFNRYIFILIIILYSFTLTFPFYNATNFKLVLEKPIKKILKIL